MKEYIVDNLAVPIVVAIIGGFIVLWLWKINTKKHENRELYLPLLNEFSASLSKLVALTNRNYPRSLSEDTFTHLLEKHKATSAFINLPTDIRNSLAVTQEIKANYLTSLNALIKRVATLEAIVERREHKNKPTDYYVIDFIMFESPPNSDVLLNFPVSSGGFHRLYCDKNTARRIYAEANEFAELAEYRRIKSEFLASIKNTLNQVSREQNA